MTEHLDDDTFERLAMRELDPTARDAALAHVVGCPRCAAIHKALVNLEVGAREARLDGVPAAASRPRRWVWGAAGALAAAAIVMLWIGRHRDEPSNLRGSGAALQIDTVGDVREPIELAWQPTGAASYRVEVFDGLGKLVWSRDVSAPPARWPANVTPAAASYRWKVEALDGNSVIAESPLGSFRVVK